MSSAAAPFSSANVRSRSNRNRVATPSAAVPASALIDSMVSSSAIEAERSITMSLRNSSRRKSLARPGDPPGIRFKRGQLEQHVIEHVGQLLNDEHALRRLSEIEEAGALRTLFATAHLLALTLREIGKCKQALRNLIASISIRSDCIAIEIKPAAWGIEQDCKWKWTISLPELRISFLSPKIVEAIVECNQPKGLSRRVLLACDLPIDWAQQERLFGLAA